MVESIWMKSAGAQRVVWKPEAIALAEREGIDLSLLESGLRKTVEERIIANDGALRLVRVIEQGRRKLGGKPARALGAVDRE